MLPPDQALDLAQRLLDDELPFHAHEVLEGAWKQAVPGERDLWHGLAQLAVGLTHQRRGNEKGAVALLRRGADRLAPYRAGPPHGVDIEGLLSWAAAALMPDTQHMHTLPVPQLRAPGSDGTRGNSPQQ